MSNPYIGEIRIFAGNFGPAGWAMTSGQLLPISGNEALFQLIGTTYGGDGQNTFALPNLASRIPMHMGTGSGLSTRQIGEIGGVESAAINLPARALQSPAVAPVRAMSFELANNAETMSPYLALNFIISLFGIFPPRS